MIGTKQNFIKNNFFALLCTLCSLFLFSSCNEIENFSLLKKTPPKTDGTNVAILLPTTGPDAELYRELNKMVKIGLSDGAQGKIKVTSYDSSNRQVLAESMEKIIDNNTDIIIGPVFSEAAEYAHSKLKNKKTTIITLSNNPVLADANLFVFGHAPMRQTEYLVDQLLKSGYNNYIALLPSGRYSQSVSSVLQEMLTSRDAALIRVEYYNHEEEDIARAVKIVSDNVDNLNEADYNLKQPVILLADDPHTLKKVFAYAAQYKLDRKSVLAGDSRININTSNNMSILFTGSANPNSEDVRNKASKLNINHVGFMHEIAYDAGLVVAKNLKDGYSKNDFISKIKQTEFQGLSGKIHFIDSIAQRQYDLIKKHQNNFVIFNQGALSKPHSQDQDLAPEELTPEPNTKDNLDKDNFLQKNS